MGRCNTHSKPTCSENKSQNPSLGLDQPERCPARFLPSTAKMISSPGEALLNQRIGRCCIDRVSPQRLSEMCRSGTVGTWRIRGRGAGARLASNFYGREKNCGVGYGFSPRLPARDLIAKPDE